MYPYAKRSRDVISTCPAYTRSALHRRVNRKFRALERGANKDVALLRHGMGTQRFRHGLYIAVTKRFRYGYGTFAVRLRCSTVKCTVRLRHGCVTVTARLRYGTVRYGTVTVCTVRCATKGLFYSDSAAAVVSLSIESAVLAGSLCVVSMGYDSPPFWSYFRGFFCSVWLR